MATSVVHPVRPRSAIPVPDAVHGAFVLWLAAIAAGVFETVLAVGRMPGDGTTSGGTVADMVLRCALLAVLVVVTVLNFRMRQGYNGARIALAVLLGGVVLLSMVVAPLHAMADGASAGDLLRGSSPLDMVFGTSRTLQAVAVVAALVLTFRPAAQVYFRVHKARTGRAARPRRMAALS
jgi:hypothetical protein